MVDYCIENHGLYPSISEKTALAKAVVKLFPAFRLQHTKYGIVSRLTHCFLIYLEKKRCIHKINFISILQEMFYNSNKNSGWMLSVLKTRRMAEKKNKDHMDISDSKSSKPDSIMYTDENAKTDVEFLKTCLVTPVTLPVIKEKLLLTTKYRKTMCKDPNTDLRTIFPYFYTHPELVSTLNIILYIMFIYENPRIARSYTTTIIPNFFADNF